MTTIGKYRHLSRVANSKGHFIVLAIDHRGNLRTDLKEYAGAEYYDEQFAAYKQQVIGHLSPMASGMLLDPAYGIARAVATGHLSGQQGLLAPLEETDYSLAPGARPLEFLPGWTIPKIKRSGADGVKLLLPFNPEATNADTKRATVEQIIAECARHDIPFFLEPIAHALDESQKLPNDELRRLSVAMAEEFSAMGVDVLKMAFPLDVRQEPDEAVWRDACAELDTACKVPWALLSAGVDFDTFLRQTRIAAEAGSSGVIVGRALWAESVRLQGEERETFLATTARARFEQLNEACAAGPSWTERVSPPDTSFNWYEPYGDFSSF